MWSLFPRKVQVMIVAGCGIAIAWAYEALDAYLTGEHPTMLHNISIAATIIGVILTFLAEISWRWIWRKIPILGKLIFPDLNGVWEGTLKSTWINPETGVGIPPIPVKITVRQKLFSVSVSLKTGESQSHSTRAYLEPFREIHRFRIWYSYRNEPLAQVQARSAPHDGVAFLDMEPGENANRLCGRYYTERRTTGDIDVSRSSPPKKRRAS